MANKTITLDVTGMSCDGCVKAVRAALTGVEGVSEADVNLESHTAVVTYDDSTATVETMIAEVEDFGYGAARQN
ncbi:MAG: heavy-metal-associated domain-containing protein [Chloroflexi bacterium]|nr:heavy-metal-associated domain-containing protein [Chloroflexota bacterium]